MYNKAFIVLLRRNFPYFLYSYAVVLRIFARVQGELFNQLLTQMTPAALGKQGVFCVQLHALRVAAFVLT